MSIIAPVNVRAHMKDGSVVALETVYVGVNASGLHVWRATRSLPRDEVKHISVEVLPPMTVIQWT